MCGRLVGVLRVWCMLHVCVPCGCMGSRGGASGEIRGTIAFPTVAGTAYLSGAQQPVPVSSNATGVGSVVLTGPTTVNVSLWVSGLVGQTLAHLHVAGMCVALCMRVCIFCGVSSFCVCDEPVCECSDAGALACSLLSVHGVLLIAECTK